MPDAFGEPKGHEGAQITPKAARSGPKSMSLSETTLCDAVGRGQPVEKGVVGPIGGPRELENETKASPKHCQDRVIGPRTGGTRAREGVFNRLAHF